MSEPTKCLRCQGDLKAGFIPDGSYNSVFLSSWVEGTPEISTGSRATAIGGGWMGQIVDAKNLINRPKLPIIAYRCTSCGMLEIYARQNDA
jgi:hypothetical protein